MTPTVHGTKRKTTESALIGCNIKPGQPRGGMMVFKCCPRPSGLVGSESKNIKEAASVFLEKRGFHHAPNTFRDQISQAVVEARAKEESAP